MTFKVPESVLVVIYTPELQTLLLERTDHPGFWQSVTGSLAESGEPLPVTCAREVEEETGLRCLLGAPAGETRYRDSKGRDKVVRYWLMEPESDTADRDFVAVSPGRVRLFSWRTATPMDLPPPGPLRSSPYADPASLGTPLEDCYPDAARPAALRNA